MEHNIDIKPYITLLTHGYIGIFSQEALCFGYV